MPLPKQPPVIAIAPSTIAGPMPVTVGFGKPFQEWFGVGKTKQASLINRGILESFMVDGRRMIVVRSYTDYVIEQLAAEAARREAGEPAKMKGHAFGGPIPPKGG